MACECSTFDLLPSKATISDFIEVLYSGGSHVRSSFTVHIDSNKKIKVMLTLE